MYSDYYEVLPDSAEIVGPRVEERFYRRDEPVKESRGLELKREGRDDYHDYRGGGSSSDATTFRTVERTYTRSVPDDREGQERIHVRARRALSPPPRRARPVRYPDDMFHESRPAPCHRRPPPRDVVYVPQQPPRDTPCQRGRDIARRIMQEYDLDGPRNYGNYHVRGARRMPEYPLETPMRRYIHH